MDARCCPAIYALKVPSSNCLEMLKGVKIMSSGKMSPILPDEILKEEFIDEIRID